MQVRNKGVWTVVPGLSVVPVYPGANGISYETFTLMFPPVTGDGIRQILRSLWSVATGSEPDLEAA